MYYLYKYISEKLLKFAVVPNAGTWIEIGGDYRFTAQINVVPNAGTWIEITASELLEILKLVVPNAGTWIEILIIAIVALIV